MIQNKIKLLIVDDSILYRNVLKQELGKDSKIEIVGMATDPIDAQVKIKQLQPDILTLDVEMPKMDGITFLKKLMKENPVRVVLVSSLNISVFDAMSAGAVDFVKKPDMSSTQDIKNFYNELRTKVKIASIAKIKTNPAIRNSVNIKLENISSQKIIAIGASTGGTEAILSILKELPQEVPGIVVTQHMPAGFTKMYAERLNRMCKMEVREGKNGDRVTKGLVLIAPGDKQMRLFKDTQGYYVRCAEGEKVSGHCPSVDVLFSSVASVVGKNAVGIILTGMGRDGADGMLQMKKAGAYTIGQDKESCIVYGMPMVAFNIGAVIEQQGLDDIPNSLIRCLNKR